MSRFDFFDDIRHAGTYSDAEFLSKCKELYPEVDYYRGPAGFRGSEIEQKRTEQSLLTLFWILQDNYDAIVVDQPADVKLTRVMFDQLRDEVRELLDSYEKLDTMLTTMAIHDLGKIEWFAAESGANMTDHDEMIPSFQRLSISHQNMIRSAWALRFNLGQFTQGENLPANLTEVIQPFNQEGLPFYFLHEIFRLAGVMAGVKRGAFTLNENNLFAYRAACRILLDPNYTTCDQKYVAYLRIRNEKLNTYSTRAYVRLCCMARFYEAVDGQFMIDMVNSLDPDVKTNLTAELMNNGLELHPGILVYYAPQLLVNCMKEGQKGLLIGLQVLERVFRETRKKLRAFRYGVYTVNIAGLLNCDLKTLREKTVQVDLERGVANLV